MIKVTINDLVYHCPQNFDEMDFETFCRLQEPIKENTRNKDLDMFCKLVGCSYADLQNADVDFKEYIDILINLGSFLYEKIDFENLQSPKFLYLDGFAMPFPKSIERVPFGMTADCQVLIQNKDLQDFKVYADVCAEITAYFTYYCKNKKYDYESALELLPKIKKMPFKDVFAVGVFFLTKTAGSMSGIMKDLKKANTQPSKFWQGIKTLAKRGVSFWR